MIMLEPKSSDKVDGERYPLSLHKKTVGLYVVWAGEGCVKYCGAFFKWDKYLLLEHTPQIFCQGLTNYFYDEKT